MNLWWPFNQFRQPQCQASRQSSTSSTCSTGFFSAASHNITLAELMKKKPAGKDKAKDEVVESEAVEKAKQAWLELEIKKMQQDQAKFLMDHGDSSIARLVATYEEDEHGLLHPAPHSKPIFQGVKRSKRYGGKLVFQQPKRKQAVADPEYLDWGLRVLEWGARRMFG
ncbi:hypothetical protein LTR66_016583 [Elasticomyces elasticus]|nr:hypothetical protein LTR66_016583 [Elasticomyces elasticus]